MANSKALVSLLLSVLLILQACTVSSTTEEGNASASNLISITGLASYRERILPPPNSYLVVKLLDVSRADAASTVLAEQNIPLRDRSVPVVYKLDVDSSQLDPRMTYSVRAEIRDSQGGLLWTSTMAQLIDSTAGSQNLPLIVLSRVSRNNNPGAGE